MNTGTGELVLSKRVSPFAFILAKSQMAQSMNYSIEHKYENSPTEIEATYIVKKIPFDSDNSLGNAISIDVDF